jgi:hypothetical protein
MAASRFWGSGSGSGRGRGRVLALPRDAYGRRAMPTAAKRHPLIAWTAPFDEVLVTVLFAHRTQGRLIGPGLRTPLSGFGYS